uniref:N-acyl-aliphatic-L-amino acid amidohydrolase n=1 Tax=Palpitomonas bilix TaxID=652834 RepID=A0A7S3DA33_9EUKA
MGERMSAIRTLQKYIRINTVTSSAHKGGYAEAARFLIRNYGHTGCEVKEESLTAGRPHVVFTYKGTSPHKKSVMLYSHTDVVPAPPEEWKYPPFSAHIDEEGTIFGRGVQDMKSVGIQHMEAMKELVKEGVTLDRTVHVVFMPDEENGGDFGMKLFVQKGKLKELNPAVVLDEGLASTTPVFHAYYAERTPLWVKLTAAGPSGHGSRLLEGTAMERMMKVMCHLYSFRSEEEQRMISEELHESEITSVNCTVLRGGAESGGEVAVNLIPSTVEAHVDMRVAVDRDLLSFRDEIKKLADQHGVKMEVTLGPDQHSITSTHNEWWAAFEQAAERAKIEIKPLVFAAATDSKHIRRTGVPSIGFSPISNTKVELHSANESLHRDVFQRGIEIYKAVITHLANHKDAEEVERAEAGYT